jgi:hypothetical protein
MLAVLLVVALWFAGSLGLVHRSLHMPGLAQAAVATATAHARLDHYGHQHHDGAHATDGLAKLFVDHSDADCRLYDQLSHGAGLPGVPMLMLPVLLPSATFAWLQGEALARWVALFDARGPPSAR